MESKFVSCKMRKSFECQHKLFHFHRGVVKSSSGESLPAGASAASSHPYKIPQPPSAIVKYDSDFPLRKTGKNHKEKPRNNSKKKSFFCVCVRVKFFNEINKKEVFLNVACSVTPLKFIDESNLKSERKKIERKI